MNFIGIIADIVASRAAADRRQLQEKLINELENLNSDRGDVLASPYTVTLGDEFQALYYSPSGLFSDLWRISAVLHPTRVRYSIALGKLTTPVNKKWALGMDGPVFYIARDGIEQAKELGTMFRVGGGVTSLELINDSLALISHLASNWSSNRMAIEADFSIGKPVKEISKRVGISESGVYKNINVAALDTITAITRGIERALEESRGHNQ